MREKTPLIAQVENTEGGAKYLTWPDVLEMKLTLYAGVLSLIAKLAYDWWKENRGESARLRREEAEQIRKLVEYRARDEERWRHVERTLEELASGMIQRHELHEVVRTEIEYLERMKRQ